MTDLVLVEIEDAVATLTLNNPQMRNPIPDIEMIDALISALQRVGRDRSVRAVILTEAGKAFSSGGNLQKIGSPGELGGGDPIGAVSLMRTRLWQAELSLGTSGLSS